MFAESGMLQAVGRFLRAKEQPEAGEKGLQHRPADDQVRRRELPRSHSGDERTRAETHQRMEHHAAAAYDEHQQQEEQHPQEHQQHLHVKEEHVGGWLHQPAPLPRSGLKTAPERFGVGLARGGEAGRVVGGASSSDRWAALQVSIPRLEVNGPTAKVVADGGISSGSSSGSVTAAAVVAALSGVSPRAHGWQGAAGVQASPASSGIGEGGATALLVGPPSDGGFGGIAPGNSATRVSGAMVAASSGVARAEGGGVAVSSLLLTDSRPLSLPAIRGTPERILDQPPMTTMTTTTTTPPSKNMSPVEIHVNEDGEAVYRFSKSAPARRGKWSRMEEEYAKRIIRDFDDGVLDAPAGVGLRQLLSSELHCEVMRVSKKFCGWQCVGKRCYRPVFHHDGRTTRARASLFEMEQNWLKTFPAPSRAEPARKLSIGGDVGGGDSTTPVDGGSERPAPFSPAGGVGSRERGATPAQTWHSGVERELAGDTSTGDMESPGKEGRSHCERTLSESLDEEPRDASSRGERGQEVERKLYGGRGLASTVADGGDQQQMRAVSRAGGHDHRGRHSVGTGSGSVDPNGRHGVNRRSWTPSSSHGSNYMKGVPAPSEPVAYPRQQHCDNIRPPAGISLLQRAEADRLPSGSTGGCDRDADLYPVFSKRGEGAAGAAVAVQRVANEGTAIAGGRHGVSRTSGKGWAQGQEARPHQRQPQFPSTNSRRGGGYARENSQNSHPEGIRTTVSGSPAGGMSLAWREHDVGRHEVSAADQTYPDPFPHYESGRQLAASGSYTPRSYGDNGGRATRSDGGRTPFRLKPDPAALPLHLRVDNPRETFFPGNEQAATTIASEPGRSLPGASYRAGPPPEPSLKQHHALRQFSEGPEHQYYSAKAERRAWENDLAAGLEEHRPAKTPRVTGSFSHVSAGGSSGGRGDDNRRLHPRYQKHQQKHQQQRQRQRRHTGTATAVYWQSGQTADNGDACAAVEAYSPASLGDPMGGDATPPHRPPSRDCFFRVSASPISMVVPSNEYGPVVVGPGRVVQSFCAF